MMGVFVLAELLSVASAQAATCQTIEDADQWAYCRPMQTGSRGHCVKIGSYDLRQSCHAKLSGNPSLSNLTANGWEREQCRKIKLVAQAWSGRKIIDNIYDVV
jgi:hypothetical protein